MSRQKTKNQPGNKAKPQPKKESRTEAQPLPLESKLSLFPLKSFRIQAVVIAIIGLVFYFNSCYNEYALDDGIVILQNEFVQEGTSGIDDILSKDAYYSFYSQMGANQELTGGRYRPLSIVTFAMEQQMFGHDQDPKTPYQKENETTLTYIRHFMNVALYVLSAIVLLYFLQQFVFRKNPDIAFLATLIFLIHPIHTEVVANVKSRDEIMSFLFIILTFTGFLHYRQSGKTLYLLGGGLMFFLALLSKEYAITLLGLIPVLLFIQSPGTLRESLGKLLRWSLPVILTGAFILVFSLLYKSGALGELDSKQLTRLTLKALRVLLVLLIVLAPVILFLFRKELRKEMMITQALSLVAVIYLLVRIGSVPLVFKDSPEVLNNPYMYATETQETATKLFMPLNYLKLLFFPHPLSSDYSYNHYPYRELADPLVATSILVHLGMILATVILFIRRHILAFALLFYLAHLAMVGNFVFDIGATMGERLMYHSSLGFAIVVAFLLVKGLDRFTASLPTKKLVLGSLVLVVVGLSGFKTIERNMDWKDDYTLFTKDVNTVPNSVLANGNAGARYVDSAEWPENRDDPKKKQELIRKGLQYLKRAVEIHPGYVNGWLNIGFGHYKLEEYEKAVEAWGKAKEHFPSNPILKAHLGLAMQRAGKLGGEKNYAEAIRIMENISKVDTTNPEVWYHLGGAYYTIKDYQKARIAWTRCLTLKPDHPDARMGMSAIPAGQ